MFKNHDDLMTPHADDARMAQAFALALSNHNGADSSTHVTIRNGTSHPEIILTPSLSQALIRFLTPLGQGHSVSVSSYTPLITVSEAASILNVSRRYVLQLVEQSTLIGHESASGRLLDRDHVLAYREKSLKERTAALNELVALSEEIGLYDSPIPK